MSSYFATLDVRGRERYKEKLEAVGLSVNDDPYLPCHSEKFCSTYTQEQLLSWKQLEAYNYFENGHVRTVLSMMFGSGDARCVLLKAKVNPSQKGPDHAHEAWMIARKDGQIVCAHCTCMAG